MREECLITPSTQVPIAAFLFSPVYSVEGLLRYATACGCQDGPSSGSRDGPRNGLILEFGVASGWSTKVIRSSDAYAEMYGFDTFEGLPLDWHMSRNKVWPRGSWHTGGEPPDVPGVNFIKGVFQIEGPRFLRDHPDRVVGFLSIDSDLYSSARSVLNDFDGRIKCGTVIYFDEICDWGNQTADRYPYWPDGEYKAFYEWIRVWGREVEAIGRNDRYGAAVRVLK